MRKLLIIGIDALDPNVLCQMHDKLPNFQKIIGEGHFLKSQSIFPPDSIAAWTSIHTGISPAKHGIVDTLDFFNNKNNKLNMIKK